ncbi:hypothetical protein TRVA0_024S00650 [Trichomonascus vanleenenianus]|uniref:glycoside hydrolase family 76 protein n=1 Tax=Trichomonascus vanleenenianus TaxID=2268995 RepID=UPI003ECAFB28
MDWLLLIIAAQTVLAAFVPISNVQQLLEAQGLAQECRQLRDHATIAAKQLITMYRPAFGLWGKDLFNYTEWWNSANSINILADYGLAVPDNVNTIKPILENTFYKGQEYGLTQQNDTTGLYRLLNSQPVPVIYNSFFRSFYDDDGWWALAWIASYDLTQNADFLIISRNLFEHMKTGWTDQCNGGLVWNTDRTYKNAIPNELFLQVSSALANRVSSADKQQYLDWALREYEWFMASGMINQNNLINDGLDNNCQNNNGDIWSYNQGVILGGLVELNLATGNETYLQVADAIASAAITHLSQPDGILHDICEPDCLGSSDAPQFKGIFMRNLAMLQRRRPNGAYLNFLNINAVSVWSKARNDQNQFGDVWSGPPKENATMESHASGLDALIAAISTSCYIPSLSHQDNP